MRKKPLYIIIMMAFLIGLFVFSACGGSKGNQEIDISDPENLPKEYHEAYNKGVLVTQKAESDPEFASYFGGCYIEDFRTLVVLLKGGGAKKRRVCKELIGRENVRYVRCDFSLQELNDIQKVVTDKIIHHQDKEIRECVTSIGLRDNINRVNINLRDNSEAAIEQLKEAVPEADDPRIVFNTPVLY